MLIISFTYGLFHDAISIPYCRDYDCTMYIEWWFRKYVEGLNRITKAGSERT